MASATWRELIKRVWEVAPLLCPRCGTEMVKLAMNSALRVVHHGQGCVVLWQVPPWESDEQVKPYLRTSKRRAEALAARLLANLGASFRTPLGERFATPLEQAWLKSYYLDVPVAADDPYAIIGDEPTHWLAGAMLRNSQLEQQPAASDRDERCCSERLASTLALLS